MTKKVNKNFTELESSFILICINKNNYLFPQNSLLNYIKYIFINGRIASVVYFDKHLSAVPSKHWLKYTFVQEKVEWHIKASKKRQNTYFCGACLHSNASFAFIPPPPKKKSQISKHTFRYKKNVNIIWE